MRGIQVLGMRKPINGDANIMKKLNGNKVPTSPSYIKVEGKKELDMNISLDPRLNNPMIEIREDRTYV